MAKVTTARSKVKSRSHQGVAHLHPPTNIPTKFQIPTPYGFQDIDRTRFSNSMSIRQGQRSNESHYTSTSPNDCPYQVSASYNLQFLKYSLDNIFALKVTAAR